MRTAVATLLVALTASATPTTRGHNIYTDGGIDAVARVNIGDGAGLNGAATGSLPACNATAPLAGGTRGLTQYDTTTNTLKYCNGTSYVELTGSTGPSWQSIFDTNLTTSGSQTLNADGNYTIGGVVWTKFNSASDATAMALTSGVGLVIQPVAASEWYNATRTMPGLTATLPSLISAFTADLPTRFSAEFSGNYAANFDSFRMGVETTTPVIMQFTASRGFITAQAVYVQTVVNGADVFAPVTPTALGAPYSTAGALRITLPNGVAGGRAFVEAGSSLSALVPASQMSPAYGPLSVTALTDDLLTFGAVRIGSATALSVTVTRIKLEVYR